MGYYGAAAAVGSSVIRGIKGVSELTGSFGRVGNPAFVNSRELDAWSKLKAKHKTSGSSEDKQALDAASAALSAKVTFEQVLRSRYSLSVFAKLLRLEAVHKLDTVQELLGQRIGDAFSSKRCYARVFNTVSGYGIGLVRREIASAIYTSWNVIDLQDGKYNPRDLLGNIKERFLDNEPEPFSPPIGDSEKAVVVGLCTISTNREFPWDVAADLAKNVYGKIREEAGEQGFNVIITSLSPVRDFHREAEIAARFAASDYAPSDDEQDELRAELLHYLMTQRDPVMNFHLKNGAFIGDIKFNSGNDKDPVMVNYVYPASDEERAENARGYEGEGIKPMAGHLCYIIQKSNPELMQHVRPLLHGDEGIAFNAPAGVLIPANDSALALELPRQAL